MSTEERFDAKKSKVDELRPFRDHPFKVMEDEEMERLKESTGIGCADSCVGKTHGERL